MKKYLFLVFFVLFLSIDSSAQFSWYKSQLETGIGNCGPACVAMAVGWSKGRVVSVQEVRSIIGYRVSDGSTSFAELMFALDSYNVPYTTRTITSRQDLLSVRPNVFIIGVVMKGITNRGYDYSEGHYLLITGVRGRDLIVQDPLGGPDRYYNATEVWKSLRSSQVIVISEGR